MYSVIIDQTMMRLQELFEGGIVLALVVTQMCLLHVVGEFRSNTPL
jgi:hypothetical protein